MWRVSAYVITPDVKLSQYHHFTKTENGCLM